MSAKKKPMKDEIDQAIDAFLNGQESGAFGRYVIHANQLVYKTQVRDTVFANLIAIRIDSETYLGNSSVLSLIGRTMAFGREKLNREETEIQKRLSFLVPMIPFTVFHEAGLDITKYRLLDRGNEEIVSRFVEKWDSKKKKHVKVSEKVHFTGASLFEIQGRFYLFDIDRREIDEGIFNPFLAEIPAKVSTIKAAYQALKPDEVRKAELKGLQVLRQGEWFFIPVKGDFKADELDADRDWNEGYVQGVLRAGPNRPNRVSRFNAEHNVFSGTVEHDGREHAPLELNGWFKAVPNTATRSFTITGDVD